MPVGNPLGPPAVGEGPPRPVARKAAVGRRPASRNREIARTSATRPPLGDSCHERISEPAVPRLGDAPPQPASALVPTAAFRFPLGRSRSPRGCPHRVLLPALPD